jgi:hypothetical protein
MPFPCRLLPLLIVAALALDIGAATVFLQQQDTPTTGYLGTVDAFVTSTSSANASPTRNYGAAGSLAISAPTSAAPANTKGEFQSMLQFDLALAKSTFDTQFGLGGWTVTSVQLGLTATAPANAIFNSSAAGNIDVRWLTNDSWVEGSGTPGSNQTAGLTFNNLSTYLGGSDQALGTFLFGGGTSGTSTFTLTLASGLIGDIINGAKATFQLKASAGSQVSSLFNSRDFTGLGASSPSVRPSLSITAVAAPEPGRTALVVVAGIALGLKRRRNA